MMDCVKHGRITVKIHGARHGWNNFAEKRASVLTIQMMGAAQLKQLQQKIQQHLQQKQLQ